MIPWLIAVTQREVLNVPVLLALKEMALKAAAWVCCHSLQPHFVIILKVPSLSIIDIDECQNDTDNCHDNANCNNTFGSFTCACQDGYRGDGVTCTGKNA